MIKCPNCSGDLEHKQGQKKICAQIGNPEIAVILTDNPHFCGNCNEYFLDTSQLVSAIQQIAQKKEEGSKTIEVGIYK